MKKLYTVAIAALSCLLFQDATAQITVSGFAPTSGSPGDTIVITGTNLTTVTDIRFGNTFCGNFVKVSGTTIKAVVGVGATGSVAVGTLSQTVTVPGFVFVPLPIPSITSFSPGSGPAGTSVTITGNNFSAIPAENVVNFGYVNATVTAASPTSLTVTVPPGAEYRPVTVTRRGLTAYSSSHFITTFTGGGVILPSSFAPKQDFGAGSLLLDIETADIDGDGKQDIVVPNTIPDEFSVLRNLGSVGAPSFGDRRSFPAGISPQGIATGDLDGDGQPDVVVTNTNGGFSGISVFRNTSTPGNVSFTLKKDYETGNSGYSYPEDAVIRDLDGDGRAEVAVLNGDATVTIYRNRSIPDTIVFASDVNFPVPSGSGHLTVADLNNDGKAEIIVTNNFGHNFTVLRNTSTVGALSFANTSHPALSEAVGICAGDIDGDGKPDIAVTLTNSNIVSLYRNTSSGATISFAPSLDLNTGDRPEGVALGDLDGDGKADLAVANYGSAVPTVSVYRNVSIAGAFSFVPDLKYPATSSPMSIAIADMDMDGTPDIVCDNSQAQSVSVIRNRVRASHITSYTPSYAGTGTVVTISGYNLNNVTAVDFGGTAAGSFNILTDNSMTAVVAGGASGDVRVVAPFGNGISPDFKFRNTPLINYFSPASGAVGSSVVITGANFSPVPADNIVHFGPVKATVTAASSNSLTVTVPSGAACVPITVTTGNLTTASNNSFDVTFPGSPAVFLPGSFSSRLDITTVTYPGWVSTGDFDGDGKPDLAVTDTWNGIISVLKNTSTPGAISFGARTDIPNIRYYGNTQVADFDGDGKLDFITTGTTMSIFRNTSSGGAITFAAETPIPGTVTHRYAIGDLDNDGYPDVVLLNSNSFSVLRNISSPGNIAFTHKTYEVVEGNPFAVQVCDLNNDGKSDLIITRSSDDVVQIFPNRSTMGNIIFGPKIGYYVGDGPYESITAADLNGDNKPDLAIVNYNGGSVSTLKNVSDTAILFEPDQQVITLINPVVHASGDLDGDGKQDLAVLHNHWGGGEAISLLKNTSGSNISFGPKLDLVPGEDAFRIIINDLDGDSKPEIIVPSRQSNILSIFRNEMNEPVVVGSGNNPVVGNVAMDITLDPALQTHNGRPYVQRHYDIEPYNNPATSTATVTLFFTQQEFDNYNAHPAHGADLPADATDVADKANLRIYQYHGTSPTGLPGSYSGGGVEIDPDDNNIVWNATAQWWEITFNIDGFSGFFLGSTGNSILPLNLVSFYANPDGSNTILKWVTADEVNVARFELERSVNGADFNRVAAVKAAGHSTNHITYQYTDQRGNSPVYYYRLKIVDRDDKFTYSHVIRVKSDDNNTQLGVYPNPAGSYIIAEHPSVNRTATLKLVDAGGKIIAVINVDRNSLQTRVQLPALPAGNYRLMWSDGTRSLVASFIKQ